MGYLFLIFLLVSLSFSNDFRRDSSKEVIDSKNKLMWIEDITVIKLKKNHENVTKYCENLDFAGFTNCRIPDIEEFKLIVDKKMKEII